MNPVLWLRTGPSKIHWAMTMRQTKVTRRCAFRLWWYCKGGTKEYGDVHFGWAFVQTKPVEHLLSIWAFEHLGLCLCLRLCVVHLNVLSTQCGFELCIWHVTHLSICICVFPSICACNLCIWAFSIWQEWVAAESVRSIDRTSISSFARRTLPWNRCVKSRAAESAGKLFPTTINNSNNKNHNKFHEKKTQKSWQICNGIRNISAMPTTLRYRH